MADQHDACDQVRKWRRTASKSPVDLPLRLDCSAAIWIRSRIASPANVPEMLKRCLTKHAPVGLLVPAAEPQLPFQFINQCLLTLALWSCGRRVSVAQAQRQIHRALRAAVTIAEVVVRTIAERA